MQPDGEQLVLDASNGLVLTGERAALSQWLRNALLTRRGVEQALPPTFGSTLGDIVGLSLTNISEIEEPVATAVESTILFHDRVAKVANMTIDFVDYDRIGFDAELVLDDDATLGITGGVGIG